ncbi:hypothetical protein SAMN05443635_101457 [Roseobacter denitrificans OCh 114]|nr:hypothetical protein SAMN05443635_101457 [Roseobacter denitrificans OCh 114]
MPELRGNNLLRQIGKDDAPQHVARQIRRLHLVQPRAHALGKANTDSLWRNDPVEHEGPGFRVVQRLSQEILYIENFNAALLHIGNKLGMVPARLLYPQNIVEQQIFAVSGGQAIMRERRPRYDYPPQLANNLRQRCHFALLCYLPP